MRPFVLLATRPEDAAADGEYEAFLEFSGLDERDLRRIRLEAEPMPALDLDEISGILVGGSPFNSSEPPFAKSDLQKRVEADLARLLDEVVDRDFPFLGACYGIGTLGLHQGGVVDATYAEPVSAVTVSLTDAGRQDPLLAEVPDHFEAYVGHKEALSLLPPGAVLLATSPSCPTQMFRLGSNMYATQFHPELDERGILTRIGVYDGYGYFPQGSAHEVIARVSGAAVGHAHKVLSAFVERYTLD